MIINDLEMNQDSVFRDIQCKMSIKQKLYAKRADYISIYNTYK